MSTSILQWSCDAVINIAQNILADVKNKINSVHYCERTINYSSISKQ